LRPGKCFTRAPRWAPNVPDRTLGGVYLLSVMIVQWCVVEILLKFFNCIGGCIYRAREAVSLGPMIS
jgi:hypothetical protein